DGRGKFRRTWPGRLGSRHSSPRRSSLLLTRWFLHHRKTGTSFRGRTKRKIPLERRRFPWCLYSPGFLLHCHTHPFKHLLDEEIRCGQVTQQMFRVRTIAATSISGHCTGGSRIGNERPARRPHGSKSARHLHRPAGQKGIIPTRIQDKDIEGGASRGHAREY